MLVATGLLLAMVVTAPRLGVYYWANAVTVAVERIDPDGTVQPLATPPGFERLGGGVWPIDEVEARARSRIEAFMGSSAWRTDAPAGAQFVWTVRFSANDTRLDQRVEIVWEVPGGR